MNRNAKTARRANHLNPVQPSREKFSTFLSPQISCLSLASRPSRGALAIVTKRGTGCDGRGCAFDEGRGGGRRSRVVLTPRRWRQVSGANFPGAMVARKPGHQGEHEVSRNTIAQEMPGVLGVTVVTTPRAFYTTRGTAGAPRTRRFLRPLAFGAEHQQTSGA